MPPHVPPGPAAAPAVKPQLLASQLSRPRLAATSTQPQQLPGLKAAFSNYNSRGRAEPRPSATSTPKHPPRPHEFAHNRSFELRLKNAETVLAAEKEKQQQQQQQPRQTRKWVTRKLESNRMSAPPSTASSSEEKCKQNSNTSDTERSNVSRLAESNLMAVYRSAPAPAPAICGDCTQPGPDMMNTSAFR